MTPLSPDDRLLAVRARDGDRAAFGDLVSRYSGAVYALCVGVAGADEAREAGGV